MWLAFLIARVAMFVKTTLVTPHLADVAKGAPLSLSYATINTNTHGNKGRVWKFRNDNQISHSRSSPVESSLLHAELVCLTTIWPRNDGCPLQTNKSRRLLRYGQWHVRAWRNGEELKSHIWPANACRVSTQIAAIPRRFTEHSSVGQHAYHYCILYISNLGWHCSINSYFMIQLPFTSWNVQVVRPAEYHL